jgi:hypothetical protein
MRKREILAEGAHGRLNLLLRELTFLERQHRFVGKDVRQRRGICATSSITACWPSSLISLAKAIIDGADDPAGGAVGTYLGQAAAPFAPATNGTTAMTR